MVSMGHSQETAVGGQNMTGAQKGKDQNVDAQLPKNLSNEQN